MSTVQAVPTTTAPAVAPRPALVAVPDRHSQAPAAAEPIGALPAEWRRVEGVRIGALEIDMVLVGPNGVFAVHVDPDLRSAAVRPGVGLIRAGSRRPDPVKQALHGSAALRDRLAGMPVGPFPYPVLVTATPGEDGHRLGRLLVIRPGRFAEAVWRHPSRPLTRSQRLAVEDFLRESAE